MRRSLRSVPSERTAASLDLYCCPRRCGTEVWYQWAGFDVRRGVDLFPQPRYPGDFSAVLDRAAVCFLNSVGTSSTRCTRGVDPPMPALVSSQRRSRRAPTRRVGANPLRLDRADP
jgi:hypothetical protein